jgi:hypothetical protein
MTKFPGWRTMTGVQRRNAKMHAMFDRAFEQGHTTLYSGPATWPPATEEAAKQAAIENGKDDLRERYDSWTALCRDHGIAI